MGLKYLLPLALVFANGCLAIVGGQAALPHDMTSRVTVSIAYQNVYQCSGAIVGEQAVLTTADCCRDRDAADLVIRAGSLQALSGGFVYAASAATMHPRFDAADNAFNLCVLHTAEPLAAGYGGVAVAPLRTRPAVPGDRVVAAGWGAAERRHATTPPPPPPPPPLQEAGFELFSRWFCSLAWNDGPAAPDSVLCMAPRPGEAAGASACERDAGAPVLDAEDGSLVGLVNRHADCTARPRPNLLSSVLSMRAWIEDSLTP